MPATALEQIVSLAKRRGFVFPSSAVYGGLGSTWDYGPLGVELKNNVKRAWWRSVVYDRDDMEGLDAAILMNRLVWVDRQGGTTPVVGLTASVYSDPSVARTEDLAYGLVDGDRQNIWIRGKNGGERKLTAGDEFFAMSPVWRPGREQLSYSRRDGALVLASPGGAETALVPDFGFAFGTSWSRAGGRRWRTEKAKATRTAATMSDPATCPAEAWSFSCWR